tara:strand:- start:203 stop:346 length:144 start_codon:yes stop_codon:yes gene_type:complete
MKQAISIILGVATTAFLLWLFAEMNKALQVTETVMSPSYDEADDDWW